jgi:hypothetical protein
MRRLAAWRKPGPSLTRSPNCPDGRDHLREQRLVEGRAKLKALLTETNEPAEQGTASLRAEIARLETLIEHWSPEREGSQA